MFNSLYRRRRTTASARRQLLSAVIASFVILQPVFFAAAQRRVRHGKFVTPANELVTTNVPGTASTVFINEILYDITGTDAGEFVEVAGPAGTNLTGWSIVAYNGNGGASYDTDALPSPIPSQAGGYGTVSVTYAGTLQNGSPDGVALVNNGTVVQFLCYEGTFMATNGPANGLTCTDIGVSQSGTNAAGTSLQLQGTGDNYGDFTWNATSIANTQNAPNTGQTFTAATPTPTPTPGVTLAINDVSQDEGNAGTTAYTFTVSLNTTTHGGVTFDICTADGTAQDGNPGGEDTDYTANCLTGQTIPNGSDSYQFTVNVNGDTTGEPNETFFVNVTNVTGATVGDGQGQGTIVNDDVVITPIHTIQGNGTSSPLAGQVVTTTGVVTLLRTGSNAGNGTANGYFLQTPDAGADADPNTSQGIFVFTSGVPTVAVGDEIRVTGTVVEFNGLTEIGTVTNTTVIDTGNTLPTAVTLDATILSPTAPFDQSNLEKYEAMRLGAAAMRSTSPNDNFFDIEAVLPSVPREQVFREPGIPASDPIPPDPTTGTPDCCIPVWDENPEQLKLDTNGRAGAPNTPYTSNVTFSNVSGALDFAFGQYRLVLDAGFTASGNMSAVPVPTPTANEFTVVGYNIENFNNNATQRQKAADTIRTILHYPDIIGAIEIFDLADLQALRDEINNDAVAAGDPNPLYEAYLVEANGTSGDNDQDVGYLVKTSRVAVTSPPTAERTTDTYINPTDGQPDTTHDRPPFVLRATVDPSGPNPQPVITVVNHLRSFINIELVAGDGPRVRAKRKAQAESLAGLLQELQTNNPGVPVISVGDYNAFQFNNGYDDPMSVLKGSPTADDQIVVDQSPDLVNPNFTNLIEQVPADQRYTFFFDDDGAMQVLDHVLVNGAGLARHTRTAIAHINVDFPGSPAAAFASDATRVEHNSDHDPVISYFTLSSGQAAGSLIISEFRLRGPNTSGPSVPSSAPDNEFVEIYNNTDADITVQTLDGSDGYAIVASDGTTLLTIPNGTTIPARGHWLGTNAVGFSLNNYGGPGAAEGDDGWIGSTVPDNGGVALFRTSNPALFIEAERLDAAGYTTAPALYREGAGLPTGGPEFDEDVAEWSFFRDFRAPGGRPVDTGNNAADFLGASTDGAGTGLGPRLGAPGPENLNSPIERNGFIQLALLDATQPAAAPPNRTRDFTMDPGNNSTFGTLSIRRRVVNNTGQNVVGMRFRVVNITAGPAPAGTADLRVRTSTDVMISNIMDPATCAAQGEMAPCTVTVTGTLLHEPPAQPNGGGWNSSLCLPGSLAPGESVNVQFLLGIQQTGAFRFYVNVELETETVEEEAAPSTRLPVKRGANQKATSRR